MNMSPKLAPDQRQAIDRHPGQPESDDDSDFEVADAAEAQSRVAGASGWDDPEMDVYDALWLEFCCLRSPWLLTRVPMGVRAAIQAANAILPGPPSDCFEPRWQAIIAVGEYVETHPIRSDDSRSSGADTRSKICVTPSRLFCWSTCFSITSASPFRKSLVSAAVTLSSAIAFFGAGSSDSRRRLGTQGVSIVSEWRSRLVKCRSACDDSLRVASNFVRREPISSGLVLSPAGELGKFLCRVTPYAA